MGRNNHGGSTGMSSAHFAFIPELNIGVVSEANVGHNPGVLISQTILSMLMNKNPEEEIPYYQIQSKMEKFSGDYTYYKGLDKVKVFIENGMLIAETESSPNKVKYALIPEEPELADNKFYIYSMGNKTPIIFEEKEDRKIDVYIERNCFHKVK